MSRMCYLTFSDLNDEAQSRVMEFSKEELIYEEGEEVLRREAKEMNIDYDQYLGERAERNLYSLDVEFNI